MAVDIKQIQLLINQCRNSASQAILDGDLPAADWLLLDSLLSLAQLNLSPDKLDSAEMYLEQACAYFSD